MYTSQIIYCVIYYYILPIAYCLKFFKFIRCDSMFTVIKKYIKHLRTILKNGCIWVYFVIVSQTWVLSFLTLRAQTMKCHWNMSINTRILFSFIFGEFNTECRFNQSIADKVTLEGSECEVRKSAIFRGSDFKNKRRATGFE